MLEADAKNMDKKKSLENPWFRMIGAVLFATILIPMPAQALCTGPESCGILGGFFLSMITVPISILALFLAIWPSTRKSLPVIAALPGGMVALTTYLVIVQGQRTDLVFLPLIHLALMILMIYLGRIKTQVSNVTIQS